MTPIQCKCIDDVAGMPRDKIDVGDSHWMMIDGHEVTITEQAGGESPRQSILLPKEVFDTMVRWYVTGKKNGRMEAPQ